MPSLSERLRIAVGRTRLAGLCGVRDLCDYCIHSSTVGRPISGGRAFNISACALRPGDFSASEVTSLRGSTQPRPGRCFCPKRSSAYGLRPAGSRGSSMRSANGLASRPGPEGTGTVRVRMATFWMSGNSSSGACHPSRPAPHKLAEDRVRRVIEPLLGGDAMPASSSYDYEYVGALGLIASGEPLRMANPVCSEVVP